LIREIVCRRERTGSLLDSGEDIAMMVGEIGPDALAPANLLSRVAPQ